MKILLLNPLDIENSMTFVVQPLGLMYIASAIRNSFNHTIKILDMKVNFLSEEETCSEIRKYSPDVVGIRALTLDAVVVHRIVKGIKKGLPECKIIIGGPYTNGSSVKILNDPNVDFVVIGEGEETMRELVYEIEKGNKHPDVSGIGYIRNGKAVFTPPRELAQDIDSIAFPHGT